jgi:hypothetical protein
VWCYPPGLPCASYPSSEHPVLRQGLCASCFEVPLRRWRRVVLGY